jgi:uncharacterized membrane protein YadS
LNFGQLRKPLRCSSRKLHADVNRSIAILLGIVTRGFPAPSERWQSGVALSAKQLLEVAIMLLGASISFAMIAASGSLLVGIVVVTILITSGVSFALCRMLGLPLKLSILIACGNSICGNSALSGALRQQ